MDKNIIPVFFRNVDGAGYISYCDFRFNYAGKGIM
jgi:hypothetical protein